MQQLHYLMSLQVSCELNTNRRIRYDQYSSTIAQRLSEHDI